MRSLWGVSLEIVFPATLYSQVLPTTPAVETSHLQDTSGQQRSEDVTEAQRCPEPRKSSRKLVRFEEVGEPQHNIARTTC